MKDIQEYMINESVYDDIKYMAPKSMSTENKDHFPIFQFPDGKEYILKPYDSRHKDNGHGANHQGLQFVEYKNNAD